jgi:hypothetical protein
MKKTRSKKSRDTVPLSKELTSKYSILSAVIDDGIVLLKGSVNEPKVAKQTFY